jgi:hypothetical protein
LSAGQAAAIVAAALASLGICAAGTAVAKRAAPDARDLSSNIGWSRPPVR